MALEAATIALIGTATAAAGAVGSLYYNYKASEASQKAEAARKKLAAAQQRKNIIEIIRRQQAAGAIGLSAGTAQGVNAGSSGIQGARSSQASDAGSQRFWQNLNFDLTSSIFDANAQYASAQSSASMFNQIGQAGNFGMQNSVDISKSLGSVFGMPQTQAPQQQQRAPDYFSGTLY